MLLDKDGTLLDFHRTWSPVMGKALRSATSSWSDTVAAAKVLRFDLVNDVLLGDSPFLTEPNEVVETLVERNLDVECYRKVLAATVPVAAVGATQALRDLSELGFVLALVTNAEMGPTLNQLATLGWKHYFGAVVGSDSGYGAKPRPEPIRHALRTLSVEPEQAVMVGDTGHDLTAARSASVASVLITNERHPDLAISELADHIIETMWELPPLVCEADETRRERANE